MKCYDLSFDPETMAEEQTLICKWSEVEALLRQRAQAIAALQAALVAITEDAVGLPSDPLWIVRRELIEAAATLVSRAPTAEQE